MNDPLRESDDAAPAGRAAFDIREDDLSDPAVARLLREHLAEMRRITPLESVHALGIDALREGLRGAGIGFWSVWDGEELVGCGALAELDKRSGEIKSMRTAEAHRRRGVGSRVVGHIIAEARRRGYERLCLETGSMAEFEPARKMYARHGFELRGPFGRYVEDPNSVFMELRL